MLDIDWHVCDQPIVGDFPNTIAIPNKDVWYLNIDIDIQGKATQTLVNHGPMTYQEVLTSIYGFYRLPLLAEELETIPADALGLRDVLRFVVSKGVPARFIDLLGIVEGPARMHLKRIEKISENTYHARLEPMRKLSGLEVTLVNLALDRIVQCVAKAK